MSQRGAIYNISQLLAASPFAKAAERLWLALPILTWLTYGAAWRPHRAPCQRLARLITTGGMGSHGARGWDRLGLATIGMAGILGFSVYVPVVGRVARAGSHSVNC